MRLREDSSMSERLKYYIALTRLNRPIGILLLLWPTLWALWIASEGRPDTTILVEIGRAHV